MRHRLINTTGSTIDLQTGHSIPADGHLEIEARVATRWAQTDPWFASQVRRGHLVLSEAPEGPETITRGYISRLKKADLQEYLAAHGADVTGSVDDLRARLIRVMFVSL